jgi:hypothetical protein
MIYDISVGGVLGGLLLECDASGLMIARSQMKRNARYELSKYGYLACNLQHTLPKLGTVISVNK